MPPADATADDEPPPAEAADAADAAADDAADGGAADATAGGEAGVATVAEPAGGSSHTRLPGAARSLRLLPAHAAQRSQVGASADGSQLAEAAADDDDLPPRAEPVGLHGEGSAPLSAAIVQIKAMRRRR